MKQISEEKHIDIINSIANCCSLKGGVELSVIMPYDWIVDDSDLKKVEFEQNEHGKLVVSKSSGVIKFQYAATCQECRKTYIIFNSYMNPGESEIHFETLHAFGYKNSVIVKSNDLYNCTDGDIKWSISENQLNDKIKDIKTYEDLYTQIFSISSFI